MSRVTFRKLIVTDELLSKVNLENIKLRNGFLKEKNTRSSDGTIESYMSDLNIFFCWNLLNNDNKSFVDVKKIELSDFFSYCVEELRWGSSRFSRVKSCLSSFSNFIEKYYDDKYPLFRNIVLRAVDSMPKNEVREKTVLSDEQINTVFVKLDEMEEFQISCWLALGIASGSRFSELLRFTTDIIDESNTAFDGLFLETTKAIKTKGRTKVGKLLKKYILKDLFFNRYETWLIKRKEIMTHNVKDHNFIFIKDNGDPLLESGARIWTGKIEKILGCNFYPHSLRHFFCTYLSRFGLPSELIQEIVGWSSSEMVKVYDDTTLKEKKFEELNNLRKGINEKIQQR